MTISRPRLRAPPFMFKTLAVLALLSISTMAPPMPAQAQRAVPAFAQAVAEAAAMDEEIAAFYRENGYEPIWTGGTSNRHKQRRSELLKALERAGGDHGLPVASYDTELLKTNLRRVGSTRDLGRLEVQMSACS